MDKNKYIKIMSIVITSVIIMYLVVLLVNVIKKPTQTFVAEKGRIYKEEFTEGFIIRDETLIEVEDANRGIAPIKSEGEKVAKGENVYRYFVENEEEINKKIEEIDVKIQENINEDDTYFSTDIKLINNQIDKCLDNVHDNRNSIQTILQEKNNINSNLTQKVKIKAENSDNDTLKELVNERNEYEKSLENNSEYIPAENSGVISYRVDGYEEEFHTGDFSYLNEEFLNKINIRTGQIIAGSANKGKIINNFKCYVACVLDSDEAKNAATGSSLKLRLQSTEEIPAKIIYKATQADGKELLVLEVSNNVTQLIQFRKSSFDVIWWSSSGLKIPNAALKYDGEVAYVIRNRGGLKEQIFVKILKSNDKYSIVDNYTYSELEKLGYDASTLRYKKSISVYDEIEL